MTASRHDSILRATEQARALRSRSHRLTEARNLARMLALAAGDARSLITDDDPDGLNPHLELLGRRLDREASFLAAHLA